MENLINAAVNSVTKGINFMFPQDRITEMKRITKAPLRVYERVFYRFSGIFGISTKKMHRPYPSLPLPLL